MRIMAIVLGLVLFCTSHALAGGFGGEADASATAGALAAAGAAAGANVDNDVGNGLGNFSPKASVSRSGNSDVDVDTSQGQLQGQVGINKQGQVGIQETDNTQNGNFAGAFSGNETIVNPHRPVGTPAQVRAGACHGGSSGSWAQGGFSVGSPTVECLSEQTLNALDRVRALSDAEAKVEFLDRMSDTARLTHRRFKVRAYASITINVLTLGLAGLLGL